MVNANESIVLGAPTAIEVVDKRKSVPDVPTDPSSRGSVVDNASESVAFPISRNHPAVPAAIPTNPHVSAAALEITPATGASKTRPLVAVPNANGKLLLVTMPSNVPDTAASAVNGCGPE